MIILSFVYCKTCGLFINYIVEHVEKYHMRHGKE